MRALRPTRRDLLRGALAASAALGTGLRSPGAALADDPTGTPKPGKIGDFKISLAEWSLHKRYFGSGDTARANLEFPHTAREEFGIGAVEFVNQFFKDKARDAAYLKELKQRAEDDDVACVLIMIDGEGDLSAPEKADRMKAVEAHSKWVDAAVALGCHAIRVNTGEHYSPTDVGAAAEACSALAAYGAKHKIHVICENHGGPSSNPDALLALIKAVGSPWFGTLPDFGNFPRQGDTYAIDIYEAVARMMPYAQGVSAKTYAFGPDGKETAIDYARMLKIVTDAGYTGHVGIEYEGSAPEPEGIIATRKLLESLRGTEYKG